MQGHHLPDHPTLFTSTLSPGCFTVRRLVAVSLVVVMAFHLNSQAEQPHFILVPLMAQGHILPMIDIARLLARRGGVVVTVITTPLNATRFQNVLRRETVSGSQIQLIQLRFSCSEVGLPEGSETLDSLPSQSFLPKFFTAASMLQQPIEQLLSELKPRPSCLITDVSFYWTDQIATKFGIPRIVFHGMCCFALLCIHNLSTSRAFDGVESDSEYFTVPGLPDKIEVTRAQLPGSVITSVSGMDDMHVLIKEAEMKAYGIVVNSFEELEMDYIKEYQKVKKKKVWCIGPVSLSNRDTIDKAERGQKASIDEHDCLDWLGKKETDSVIYVCLGSLLRLSVKQMIELALGLESSASSFIWVIRNKTAEFEKWLTEENFEARIKEKGLLIHGWAPQVLILSHPAVGGFLTHCGWNSTLEGISAGVPLITWPNFAEQFCNERLIVNVLKIGVSVGVEIPVMFGDQEKFGVQVNKEKIKSVIDRLMEEDGVEIRGRARELGEMANKAMEEGGSSHNNMASLIQDVVEQSNSTI